MNQRSRFHRWAVGIGLLAILASTGSTAYAQAACKAACGHREPRSGPFVEVDANTGRVISGATRFPSGQQVKVIVTNKNPYKYAYRAETLVTALEPAIAASFLKLLPGWSGIQKVFAPALGAAPACGAASTAWDNLVKKAIEVQTAAEPLQGTIAAYDAFLTATDKDDIRADCPALCDQAAVLGPALPGLASGLRDLEPEAKVLSVRIADFKEERDKLAGPALAVCSAATKGELANFEKLSAWSEAAIAARPGIEALKTTIDAVIGAEDAFEEVHHPFVPDEPSEVRVTLYRRNLRVKGEAEKVVTVLTVQVGESRLAISGGIGFSGLTDRHVVRQSGTVPDGKGGTTIGNVFAYESDSPYRPAVAVALNASLWRSGRVHGLGHLGFAMSTGFMVDGGEGSAPVEFFLGPSLTLLDGNAFLTVAAHAAREESLSGGFEIGKEVPADLQDPIPVRKDWTLGLFVGLTFRVR
jgi:hypothetical protein